MGDTATAVDLCLWCLCYVFQSGRHHDGDDQRVLTFFTHAVFLNHSCDPSAAMSNPGESVSIKALRDIDIGEEVTICYKSDVLRWACAKRRHALQHTWGFICNCSRCLVECSSTQRPNPSTHLKVEPGLFSKHDAHLQGKQSSAVGEPKEKH